MSLKAFIILGSVCFSQLARVTGQVQGPPPERCPPPVFQAPIGQKADTLSPWHAARALVNGMNVYVNYSAPSMQGREIFGSLIPYDTVWRTGDNKATYFTTDTNIRIGDLAVPAGAYSLYSLPSRSKWKLIINKQICQWGTVYDPQQDLGRVDMTAADPPSPPLETFAMKLVSVRDRRPIPLELHVMWESTDVYVTITPAAANLEAPRAPQQ